MKRIIEHIERAKTKPHHVRKRIAYVGAAAGASLIGLIWFVGNLSTGAFAIQPHSFAESADENPVIVSDTTNNSAFAGAASALGTGPEPARIEIVDAPKPSTKRQAEQTTIPF